MTIRSGSRHHAIDAVCVLCAGQSPGGHADVSGHNAQIEGDVAVDLDNYVDDSKPSTAAAAKLLQLHFGFDADTASHRIAASSNTQQQQQ